MFASSDKLVYLPSCGNQSYQTQQLPPGNHIEGRENTWQWSILISEVALVTSQDCFTSDACGMGTQGVTTLSAGTVQQTDNWACTQILPPKGTDVCSALKVWRGSQGKLSSDARLELHCSIVVLNILGSTQSATPHPAPVCCCLCGFWVQENQKPLLSVNWKDLALAELVNRPKSRRTSL